MGHDPLEELSTTLIPIAILKTRVAILKINTYSCQKEKYIMNTKLTLTIEKEVIKIAKECTAFEALTIKNLDAIITRNIKDYRNSSIAVMTPLNFLKMREKNER
ncbi:MAG: hypothetical protein R2777_09865 [Chitinophagales bacterium]